MKPIIIMIFLSSLSSCALFKIKGPDETFLYLTGERSDNVEGYEKNLTRTETMAGGFYTVSARPITNSYLKVVNQTHASLRGLSVKEQEKAFDQLSKDYLHNKTCFHFEYEVIRFSQASQLKDWKVYYTDKNGVDTLLSWKENDVNIPPVRSKTYRSGDMLDIWLGKGAACAAFSTEYKSGFSLKVKPRYVQFPFNSEVSITWDFPERIQQKGKEVWIEKDPKSKKSYRGW